MEAFSDNTNTKSMCSSKFSFFYRKLNPITGCRMVRRTDIPTLKHMVQMQTRNLFGYADIETVYQTTVAGVAAVTATKKIVAALFVNNYPNVPSIPPWDWMPWIQQKFHMMDASPGNTMFIHTVLYELPYNRDFLVPLLTKLFRRSAFCKFIVLVIPPQGKFLEWITDLGTVVTSPHAPESHHSQSLMVYLRQNFVTSYKLRMGVMEDNDDLVLLIDHHSRRLKNLYGDYYIAEMIAHDNGRHVIVAEHDDKAVAVMVFNETLDYDLLNKCFQLECFHGLKKPNQADVKKRHFEVPELRISEFCILDMTSDVSFAGSSSVSLQKARPVKPDLSVADKSEGTDLNIHMENFFLSTSSSMGSYHSSGGDSEHDTIFYGVVDSRFSCHALNFTEAQLEEFRISKRSTQIRRWTITPPEAALHIASSTPIYRGRENAFALEIIAAKGEHEDSLLRLLNAGFELFPKKDYCVLCVPGNAPSFPLLSQIMVRVPPLPSSHFPQELYVVHRNSISGYVRVSSSKRKDLPEVEQLLKRMRSGGDVLRHFEAGCEAKYYSTQSYVVKCNAQIVGVVNLRDMANLDYIMSKYQLEKVTDLSVHKPGCYGQIVHFVLSPIFQKHSKFLLSELHRLSDYSILFYLLHPDVRSVGSYRKTALACVLGDLIPVLPAKVPEYGKLEEEHWKVPRAAMVSEKPYAVYISTPVYCGLSRVGVNSRIIVVGASEAGLSFLINLIFNKIVNCNTVFANVTLVSTHGIVSPKSNRFREAMIPSTSDTGSGRHLAMLSLATFVNVVEGVMSAIDRRRRAISVNSSWLHYDLLVLTCGTQYQMPARPHERRAGAVECPENVFVVNTAEDVDVAVELLRAAARGAGFVIVYGNAIEAYCCLEALLEARVADLVFVQPPHSNKHGNSEKVTVREISHNTRYVSVFDDDEIEAAVRVEIRRAGVDLYENYRFHEWTFDDEGRRVVAVSFRGNKLLEVPCRAAFMYGKKRISRLTFDAINGANLIYDGDLVIDSEFRTNDPDIYAAGRFTKYPRRFYADHMKHKYFNQVEIGKKMAYVVLRRLLPKLVASMKSLGEGCQQDSSSERRGFLVPRYYKPIYVHARIPDGLEYFHVKKPGLLAPMDVASASDEFGQLLTTGHLRKLNRQGFFKLHLNQYNTVETIVAISRTTIEVTNLHHLWGKHETILNNLVQRFEMAMVTDLFDFFSKPWIYALYHDRYRYLERDLNSLLTSLTDEPGTAVIEDIVKTIEENNYEQLSSAQFKEIMGNLKQSNYYREMEKMVMNFLTQNTTFLPMYATPASMNLTLGAYDNSHLFKKL